VSRKPTRTNGKKTPAIDAGLVRELAAVLAETGLTEIEIERGELRLRLARMAMGAPVLAPAVQTHVISSAPVPAPPAPPPAIAPPPAAPEARAPAEHPGAVASPMVGTAYLAPEPGAPPFVKVGDSVTAGQTLMVVEAMKTFNPIPAPRAGKVTAVLVADGQPVEFGEPLVILE
jgi:acetyl-CoA carboxylase biotin carboxyl carrier protein